jgi:hypothetical protein
MHHGGFSHRSGYASLVKSVRTKAGPRLEYVAYLGRIRITYLDRDGKREAFLLDGNVYRFWRKANEVLDRLGVEGGERGRIERSLEAVVPMLPADRFAEFEARQELATDKI